MFSAPNFNTVQTNWLLPEPELPVRLRNRSGAWRPVRG
jgi:hypothetical protein